MTKPLEDGAKKKTPAKPRKRKPSDAGVGSKPGSSPAAKRAATEASAVAAAAAASAGLNVDSHAHAQIKPFVKGELTESSTLSLVLLIYACASTVQALKTHWIYSWADSVTACSQADDVRLWR